MASSKSKTRAKPNCGSDDFSIINVRIGTCPGKVEDYVLNGDRTVRCALKAANINASDFQIRVNFKPVDLDHELVEADEVLACPQVQGS